MSTTSKRQSNWPIEARRTIHITTTRSASPLRSRSIPRSGPAPAEVVSVEEIGGGWWQVITRFTLEVEGSEKPCFVGDSVTRVMAPAG
jgi:hypothetical protein